jgi:hypothetical protein
MATPSIVGTIALLCGMACGMVATFTIFEMVSQVNDKLPKGEQFFPLGWYLSKYRRHHGEYKRLFPDGRLLFRVRMLIALMFICLLVCAWGWGFFTR